MVSILRNAAPGSSIAKAGAVQVGVVWINCVVAAVGPIVLKTGAEK
jgi:hypothetical protein